MTTFSLGVDQDLDPQGLSLCLTLAKVQTVDIKSQPVSLRGAIMQWYHTSLQHPGIKNMQATVKENFYWPGMDATIDAVVCACAVCQKCKITAVKKYGKIPLPTHRNYAPWKEVHVDLIGPWDVRYNSTSIPGKTTVEKIQALTIITKATGWPEFVAIRNKTSYHIAILFERRMALLLP